MVSIIKPNPEDDPDDVFYTQEKLKNQKLKLELAKLKQIKWALIYLEICKGEGVDLPDDLDGNLAFVPIIQNLLARVRKLETGEGEW